MESQDYMLAIALDDSLLQHFSSPIGGFHMPGGTPKPSNELVDY